MEMCTIFELRAGSGSHVALEASSLLFGLSSDRFFTDYVCSAVHALQTIHRTVANARLRASEKRVDPFWMTFNNVWAQGPLGLAMLGSRKVEWY